MKKVISHRNVIDRLHDANAKFDYFNMVGGLVVNREVDRLTKNVENHLWMTHGLYSRFFIFVF